MKRIGLLAVLFAASLASAAMLEDFEDGTYAGPGTLIADPDDAANTVLQLNIGEVFSAATPGTAGIITMKIYDFGKTFPFDGVTSVNQYGPAWTVSGAGTFNPDTGTYSNQSAGARIIYRGTYLNGNNGYGYSWETGFSAWFSPGYFGGPRQVDALDDPDTTEVDESDGAWTEWTFWVDVDGKVTIRAFGESKTTWYNNNDMIVAGLNQINVSGGRNHATAGFGPVLVDDVTFSVPEPASMSLLVLGGLAMLRRRR